MTTFAELNERATSGPRCRRCGEPATHSVAMQVRALRVGQGRGGAAKAIASAGSRLCEECAVAIFEATAKALR